MASQPQAEPTMEEILASIRRIISEDSEPAKPKPAPAPVAAPAPAPIQVQPVEDVLELSEVVEEPAPPPARPEPVLTVVEPVPRPEPVVMRQPEPVPMPAPVPRLQPQPEPDVMMVDRDESTMLSDKLAERVSAQLSHLDRELTAPPAAPAAGSGKTLEDIAREAMTPMLAAWLEQNLPAIVERAVQAEIERVTQRRR